MPRGLRSLSQAVDEFLEWLELDVHRSAGTVAEYRRRRRGACWGWPPVARTKNASAASARVTAPPRIAATSPMRACSYARSSPRATGAMLFAGNNLGRPPPCHAAPRCRGDVPDNMRESRGDHECRPLDWP